MRFAPSIYLIDEFITQECQEHHEAFQTARPPSKLQVKQFLRPCPYKIERLVMSSTSSPQLAAPTDLPAVSGIQVIVREGTPFLPKLAFTLITLASFAGVMISEELRVG